MNGFSKGPWALQVAPGDSVGAVKVVSAHGGVVALLKAAGGRKMENARAVVEVPAMVTALRKLIPLAVEAIAERACSDDSADLELLPEYRRDLQEARAILSRIDGAGDTLPDAPALEPTGELVTVRADHLAALVGAADKYADDLATGLEDGTYEDRADLDAVQAAIAAVQGEN